jgi:hypothetical protein
MSTNGLSGVPDSTTLIPQPPLPAPAKTGKGKKKSDRPLKNKALSKAEKARRYDRFVVNDKTARNRNAQIGDYLDRMTFDPENLFPTNTQNLGKFVPTGFKQATVRGTRFDEPPIPFKAPGVQAAVNAAEFYTKYNRDNPIGGPYTDKRLYNAPRLRAATQPLPKSYAERLNESWDALTLDEQQVFRQAGGRWFVENYLQAGRANNDDREANIAEFVRLLNERNTIPNTSDISVLSGASPQQLNSPFPIGGGMDATG